MSAMPPHSAQSPLPAPPTPPPKAPSVGRSPRPTSSGSTDTTRRLARSPRSPSGETLFTTPPSSPPRAMRELRLAVVGAAGVGKTTFLKRALRKDAVLPTTPPQKVSLDGRVFYISLLEVLIDDVDISEDQEVTWPAGLGASAVSRLDGVLALYDVTSRESLANIPNLLACSGSGLPCLLISSKGDLPSSSRQLDPEKVGQSCRKQTGVESAQTSEKSIESYGRCISEILKVVMANEAASPTVESSAGASPGRPSSANIPRARSSTAIHSSSHSSGKMSQQARSKHGRAASEIPSSKSGKASDLMVGKRQSGRTVSSSQIHTLATATESLDDEAVDEEAEEEASTSKAPKSRSTAPIDARGDAGSGRSSTVLPQRPRNARSDPRSGEESTEEESWNESDGETLLPQTSRTDLEAPDVRTASEVVKGVTLEHLMDRLLAQPMSKGDSQFVSIFLCLYRNFAAPAEVLAAIMRRFEQTTHAPMEYLLRINDQLRFLTILTGWVAEYPGDFAHALTLRHLKQWITKTLAPKNLFLLAATAILTLLKNICEDDDTNWACSDRSRGRRATLDSFTTVPSLRSLSIAAMDDSGPDDEPQSAEKLRQIVESKERPSHLSQLSSVSSSTGRSASSSGVAFATLPETLAAAQRQAELLDPYPRILLTKVQWYQFMELDEDDIAAELTRMDWIMFTSIRPRDLIRSVSLSDAAKDKCHGLENVRRVTNHFNHVAHWITNLVLLRDKARDRARALEKIMAVAGRLRQLNSYNALGAVIAGINSAAVLRLEQTRELVPAPAHKDFMSLEVLMSTQRSYFAYRLAWENSTAARIPFLPLHRKDLVSGEVGNRTLLGDADDVLINWKKFEVMGAVILDIRRSQGMSYVGLERNAEVQRLVIDGKFSKDEDTDELRGVVRTQRGTRRQTGR